MGEPHYTPDMLCEELGFEPDSAAMPMFYGIPIDRLSRKDLMFAVVGMFEEVGRLQQARGRDVDFLASLSK